jgi:hypothetical protein
MTLMQRNCLASLRASTFPINKVVISLYTFCVLELSPSMVQVPHRVDKGQVTSLPLIFSFKCSLAENQLFPWLDRLWNLGVINPI